jgi:hypothetical protein
LREWKSCWEQVGCCEPRRQKDLHDERWEVKENRKGEVRLLQIDTGEKQLRLLSSSLLMHLPFTFFSSFRCFTRQILSLQSIWIDDVLHCCRVSVERPSNTDISPLRQFPVCLTNCRSSWLTSWPFAISATSLAWNNSNVWSTRLDVSSLWSHDLHWDQNMGIAGFPLS